MKYKDMKIGVLMGGLSSEREVSLKSGDACLKALVSKGYNAVPLDAGRDLPFKLRDEGIELAFIALHGKYGEDGTVQGILEMMGIPYTGSGVLASALAMNKILSKKVFQASGLVVAPYRVVRRGESPDPSSFGFPMPIVVKPSQEGSSVGISIVRSEVAFQHALDIAFEYGDEVLVEQFIAGREIQVGILYDRALGAIEIVPKGSFYDYEAKYTPGMAEHIMPAPLSGELYNKVLKTGITAHRALGCYGFSRVDLLVTDYGDCYVLEVNTMPGMTSLSLLPEIARIVAGIGFEDLVERMLEGASLKG